MIERYSTEEMKKIWSEDNRLEIFLRIEELVIEAMVKTGECPKSVFENRKKIKPDKERIAEIEKKTKHDILAFLEYLEEKRYIDSRYLHRGITSSDILDTATGVQIKESLSVIRTDGLILSKTLLSLVKKYKGFPCIGRTHNVYAEPTTLGLRFLNWHSELNRSYLKILEAFNDAMVGKISGAVGNYGNISPKIEKHVLNKLGLKRELPATQVVCRDRIARLINETAVFASVLERISVNIRLLHSTEINEISEGFSPGQKGSSAMPHKKNPVSSERIAGFARLIRGYSSAAQENIPLWLERDISHSSNERIILPDLMNLLHFLLRDFTRVISNLNINKQKIKKDLDEAGSFVFSGRVLTALMEKGFSRKQAYELIQQLVFKAKETGKHLRKIIEEEKKISGKFNKKELEKLFDLKDFLKHEDSIFKDYLLSEKKR
ncbi:MAG: adenylosuccinate lyase [bacterium]|nr:adenylosuccinate lyase [bacterium]